MEHGKKELTQDYEPDNTSSWRASALWLLTIFLLCGASGAKASLTAISTLGVWALVVVLPMLFLQRLLPGFLAQIISMAALVGIMFLSGVGQPANSTLGWPGFVGFHFILVAYCATSLLGVLKKATDENNLEESFLSKDLWIFNAAIACTATYTFVLLLSNPFEKAYIVAALTKGILPLSTIAGLILLTGATHTPRARRYSLLLALLAALVATGLTGGRIELMKSNAQLAQDAFEGRNIELADASSQRALTLARDLRFPDFEKKALRVRCALLPALGKSSEAPTEISAFFKMAYAQKETPETLAELEKYLKSIANAKSKKRINCNPTPVHDFFDRHPEELEFMLGIFLQDGNLAPLAERYAWAGFPKLEDTNAFESLLLNAWGRDPDNASEAEFFLGLFYTLENRPSEARRHLRKIREYFPGHFNSLTLLERNIANSTTLADYQSRERTYPPDPNAPDAAWSSPAGEITYARMEVNQYLYDININASLSASSTPKHARFNLLLNGSPLILSTGPEERKSYLDFVDIYPDKWETIHFRQQFIRPESIQFMLKRTSTAEGPAQPIMKGQKAELTLK